MNWKVFALTWVIIALMCLMMAFIFGLLIFLHEIIGLSAPQTLFAYVVFWGVLISVILGMTVKKDGSGE